VFGDPEAMKSWLLLLSAVQEIERGRHVFYMDMEDNERSIVDRLRLLGASRIRIKKHFHYFRPDDQITEHDQAAFRRLVTKHQPTLVVLDGVTEAFALHGLSINSAEEAAMWFRNFARQFQVKPTPEYDGPAIVELDHVVKSHESRNGWAIGSIHKKAGIKGAAYQVVTVAPFGKGKHGISRLLLEKDSPGGVEWVAFGRNRQRLVGELHCDATGGGGVDAWIESADPAASTPDPDADLPLTQTYDFRLLMQAVCEFVAANEGCSLRTVRGGVKGTNEHIATALDQLALEGFVENQGKGTKRQYVAVREFKALRVVPGGRGSGK
jgi:hypothetical protein